jgi:Protein of unknown function (DUF2939)
VKRLILLLVIAALGFYVAWPAWSAYRIATAVTNQDEPALAGKIDFPSLQESLRPVATSEIGKRIDKETATLGPLGQALAANLKSQMGAKIIDQVLATVVTPRSIIRIANEGGDIAASVEKALSEAAGQVKGASGSTGATSTDVPSRTGGVAGIFGQAVGGADVAGMAGKVLGGAAKPSSSPATEPVAKTEPVAASKRAFGLGNIKGFSMAGPLSFNLAIARDAAQPKADATIGMSFTGGDWKLTRIVPNL